MMIQSEGLPEIKEPINKSNISSSKKLLLILFGLTLSIFIAEVSLRAINITRDLLKGRRMARLSNNPILGYDLKPNYQYSQFRINSYGLRGKEFNVIKDKDTFRVIAIGDSITFGASLNEENNYASLLEKHLNDNRELNKYFEVINAGVGGYNIWQYLEVYKEKARKLSPDLIIVGICQNDFEVVGPYSVDLFGMVRGDFDAETRKGLLDNLAIYRTVSNGIKMYSLTRESGQDAVKSIAPILSKKWTEGSVPLNEFVKIAKEDNVPILFVIFPYRFQIKGDNLNSDEKFIEFMKDNSVLYIDLLDSFRNIGQELYVKGDYVHPNELGHKITADIIYRFLVSNGIITEDAGRPTAK